MCKIIFQILLSMTVSFQLIAQSRPIKSLSIGNQWFYVQKGWTHPGGGYACTFSYQVTKDSLINNDIFYKLEKSLGNYYGNVDSHAPANYYERADSIKLEVVYQLETDSVVICREKIYDFSMNIGETYYNPGAVPSLNFYPRVTTLAKGDTILFGKNLTYLKVKAVSYLFGRFWSYGIITIVERFGIVGIDHLAGDENYYRKLRGAVIDGKVYGDTTTILTGSWVKSVYPLNYSVNCELSPKIQISFFEPIDPAALNMDNILIYAKRSGACSIDKMDYSTNTKTLAFTLNSALAAGEDVDVTLKNLYDIYGIRMPDILAFHFKTQTTGGTGIFSKSDEFVLPHNPLALNVGDFDLDDDLDLIAGSGYSTNVPRNWISITLLKNIIQSGFVLIPSQYLLIPYPGLENELAIRDLLLIDFDLNGDLGILLTSNEGTFAIKQKEIGGGNLNDLERIGNSLGSISGDLNGDGFPDLLETDWTQIYFLMNYLGNFYRLWDYFITLEERDYRIAVGDWNNDSYLDLAVTQPLSAKLLVFINTWKERYKFILQNTIEKVNAANCIIPGDIDTDGDLDLVFSNGVVLINGGIGQFIHGTPFNFTGEKIELGDIDGDGVLDVVGISKDSLIILKNNSEGVFSRFFELPMEHHPNSLVMGDWDNDGDLDLAVAYDESNIITIFKNDYCPPEHPEFALEQNFPNPCSKLTHFFYTLPENMNVTLLI
ncbi:MAG: FG-GAP-like repeat-containing protein [bacterium]|nr:FG-GAP-like repeat-containing protein [bacterium]